MLVDEPADVVECGDLHHLGILIGRGNGCDQFGAGNGQAPHANATELPPNCNDYRVWLRNALQAGCKVRCLADDGLLLRGARAYQIADDHETGCDADTRLQRRMSL
jgi:hypothetical protein